MSSPSLTRDDLHSLAERVTSVPIAVVILSQDEDVNIEACLASTCGWAGQVFLVDSGSSDRTLEIARRTSAQIVHHPFAGYPSQRNWALEHLPIAHDWVLFLDADERLTSELRESIARAIAEPVGVAGYYVKRRMIFLGRWIRHGGYYPTWILRLIRRDAGRCDDRRVNEHLVVRGETAHLDGDLLHDDRHSLDHWIAKHNRYATLEALELLQSVGSSWARDPSVCFWGSQTERKRWLRLRIWNKLPPLLRPFIYFAYRYFLRLGFLDGRQGLIYHFLQGLWFPFLIDTRYLELRQRDPTAHA